MISNLEELVEEIGRAIHENNLDRLEELEACFLATKDPGPLPLTPSIQLDPKHVQEVALLDESAGVLGLANALSRAKRRVAYQRSKWNGVRRPVIVSEGDSWFQYPVRLDDVIDVLMKKYQLLSLGAAGDLLQDMVSANEFSDAIASENADFFLLSASGNDFLNSTRLRSFLRDFQPGMSANDLLNLGNIKSFLDSIVSIYDRLFRDLTTRFPRLTILFHGYDYVLPRPDGKWLGTTLAARGIPDELWDGVMKLLIDDLNTSFIALAANHGPRVVHVDCRGVVGKTKQSWFDELHPFNKGYDKVAAKFEAKIDELFDAQTDASVFNENLPAGVPRDVIHPQRKEGRIARTVTCLQPNHPLPESVANQFAAEVRSIARPQHLPLARTGDSESLTEALIENPSPNVGPKLRKAPPLPNMVGKVSLDDSPRDIQVVVHDPQFDPAISQNIRATIASVFEQGERAVIANLATSVPPPTEANDSVLLAQPPCSSLAAWQAHLRKDPESVTSYNDFVEVRDNFESGESDARIQTRMELMPESDLFLQERIIGESDLEQINYLSRGERAARTVGRLSIFSKYGIPAGSGSGFLVGPGLILTNHHVISDIEQVRNGSYVLFDYEYDADNRLKTSERFDLVPNIFFTNKELDFTFIGVAMTGSQGTSVVDYGWMQLIPESGKAIKGEAVSIIQHPGGLPKQIAIRNSTIVGRKGPYIYYYTDTDRGSSGAPVVNDQWFPVALHHRSVPNYFETCQYVSNRGIRVSSICAEVEKAAATGDSMAAKVQSKFHTSIPRNSGTGSAMIPGGTTLERNVEPYHELPYDNRTGYDANFLGVELLMPMVIDPEEIAAPRIDDGGSRYVLTYQHFSIVMHRQRRLAIFSAANIDASSDAKFPESGKPYGRNGLSGLRDNDREKWFEDPRIASDHQLPNRFFDKDRTAFDKGHIIRRDSVAWGIDYDAVRRANGDTYHTTNCSPQVKDFNRSNLRGIWGKLENVVFDGAKSERLVVFAGPVLDPGDTEFRGEDNDGETRVQIPSAYWKIVVARKGSGIEVFPFILEQDLTDTPFEFDLPSEWVDRQTTIAELESRMPYLSFPDSLKT